MKSFTLLAGCLAVAAAAIAQDNNNNSVYKNSKAPVEARITDLMGRLTLEEKVALTHGNFTSGGVPRLDIAPLLMLDGRQGLRPVDDDRGTKTTALPSALALSCTWDEAAAKEFGKVLAEEMLAFKRNVLLAPMLNLIRSPLGGRNFENFGEDPLLTGRIGTAYIQGVQEQGVGACSCLLVANDCEHRRHQTSSNMNERTLRELHMLSYEMSVRDGNVWSMMTGNNLYNGVYCAQNKYLLQDLMKDEIGFDGVMITDWRAAYETTPTALAGTDMTTGYCHYVFGDGNLLKAVKSGEVSEDLLEDKVRRILRLYIRSGVLDPQGRAKGELDSPSHRRAARQLAAEGMVLLKNDNAVLPVEPAKVKTILVTGPAADEVIQGGGSGNVPSAIKVTALKGLRNAFGKEKVVHLPYSVPLRPGLNKKDIEWEQSASDGAKKSVNRGGVPSSTKLAEAARSADVVIFMAAGTQASEGRDLADMDLPGPQEESIAALVKANPKTIVALANNGAVTLDGWGPEVPAILAMHYSGQATGAALADVITGKVNPGGKLSYTFGKKLEDYAVHAVGEWPAKLVLEKDPGKPGFKPEERKPTHAYTTVYKEGVFAGYRWFDDKKIEPWFPFGHGLSYTTFELSDMEVAETGDSYTVSCTVKNTGDRPGSEVVQVYVAPLDDSDVPRPPQELKGFTKVKLDAGEAQQVEVQLRPSALAYYDVNSKKWKAEPGKYEIRVGNSSRDIKLKSTVTLTESRLYDQY